MKFNSTRHGAGLVLAVAGFLSPSHPARAQTVGFSCNSTFNCTGVPVPPGTGLLSSAITSSFVTLTTDVPVSVAPTGDPSAFNSALNLGVFGVNGTNTTNSNAGDGTAAGPLAATNSGNIVQTLPTNGTLNQQFFAVYMSSRGGAGGNYLSTDTNHSAGRAGTAGAVRLTNSGTIQVEVGTNATLIAGGAALFADSIGGAGGNVTRRSNLDSNDNPQYGSQNGTPGAGGGDATVTNTGAVTVGRVLVSPGYWAVAARSIGGQAGTGNNGEAGGQAGTVSVINLADVSLSVLWGTQAAKPGYPVPQGAFALLALSQGGDGTQSVNSGVNGGAGGRAIAASVTLGDAAGPVRTITLDSGPNAPLLPPATDDGDPVPVLSAAVGAVTVGGAGGAGYDESAGGFGGTAGPVTITATNAVVSTSGNTMLGLVARATGGRGGDSGKGQDDSRAQAGGDAGSPSQSSNAAAITLNGVNVTTRGIGAPAVSALAQGGDGGTGFDFTQSIGIVSTGSDGGNGGNAGRVAVSVTGGSVATYFTNSPGIVAQSLGGRGGDGGKVATIGEGSSGAGGAGGQGSPVTVQIQGGATIATYGEITDDAKGAFGIVAVSRGGDGGVGGPVNVDFGGDIGDGGPGGAGRTVTITVEAGSTITTAGANAIAVFGLSIGGAGGPGSTESSSGGVATAPANGGAGGDSGDVVITFAGAISTAGQAAHGLAGQSTTGISGDGGNGAGIFHNPGGSAGASGTVGTVTITNTGTIATAGDFANGIQAQAIGGDTGDGGSTSGGFSGLGGTALAGANGGTVNVTNGGAIQTQGRFAMGVLAQSIGGGGGNGGDSSEVFRSVGGNGGGGGDGGTVQVTLDAGTITTTGQLAHGIVAQAIGGGGGNAGDARAADALITVVTGGQGGDGGDGGTVAVTLTRANGPSSIGTFGANAAGVVAQSIGGGGGTGGAGYATTASTVLAVSVAVGGEGGDGGTGGSATVTASGATISTGQGTTTGVNTNPVDAYGIVVQSIGGGGGIGGAAAALALTFTPPDTPSGDTYSASFAYSVGGDGGDGGAGGAASVTLRDGASVVTQGQGSHGVLVQSIGGGGGSGGDSSAMAATFSYGRTTISGSNVFSAEIAAAVGGNAANGGNGGAASATIDSAVVVTFGDYANALVVQSIGGGGGNGGIGSATTESGGSTRDVNAAIQVGGVGGTGGTGGSATVTIGPDAVMQTYGSSAHGVVAQSIGGGGGTSQGGGVSLGGARGLPVGMGLPLNSVTPVGNLTLQAGATGGPGGSGGPVTMTMDGTLVTAGADAVGVTLQSIGGGGGLSGGAGGDASSDNPVSILTRVREFNSNVVEQNFAFYASASLTVGGTGGVGGDGGVVGYTQSGQVTTLGDWATGVMAQSIGGGGGKAGVAAADTSGLGISSIIALGSTGGAGGAGGIINLTFEPGSSISTGSRTSTGNTGYAAFGVLAQSIGGGGGVGSDGSIASQGSLFLGGTGTGSGGSGGSGGQIRASGPIRITTRGDVAPGVVLQSIGGGGGIAGTGSTFTAGFGRVTGPLSIQAGGATGVAGGGGFVNVTGFAPTISTFGANAFGILAQSIGGGGGFAFSTKPAAEQTNRVGATTRQFAGNGGDVVLSLDAGGSIATQGFAAHGIVVQSIGGGGGIAGVPDPAAGTPTLVALGFGATSQGDAPGGAGGNVRVTTASPITTTGTFAHGILAQAIGGGGGIYVAGADARMGTTFNAMIGSGGGPPGSVSISVSAPITVSGENASAIFAQAQGTPTGWGANGPGYISIGVDSTVQGGSNWQGHGIWMDTPNPESLIRIGPTGSVSALSGVAIQSRNGTVSNYGTITGSYNIGTGRMYNYGTLNPGPEMAAALLVNEGTMRVGAHAAHGTSRVSGDLVQTSTGRLMIDADFANRRSDQLVVEGSAELAGRVAPVAAAVLPNVALPFLTVAGTTTGTLEAETTAVFGYEVSRAGGVFSIAATSADFTPAGFALSGNESAVAGHLQAAWNAGGTAALAPLFGLLGNTAQSGGAGAYAEQLRQLSPDATFAPGARSIAGAMAFTTAALSCPSFDGTTAMLVERQCAWGRITGRTATQDSNGVSRYTIDSTTVQIGGQVELGEGWLIGGSLGYEESRLSTADRTARGTGEAGFGAVTLKYQTGPWLFSGAAFGGYGAYDNSRTISLPGFGAVARSSPETSHAGLLLRGTYTIGAESFYARPSLTLSGVHARTGAYQETGAGALNLDVSSASSNVATLTPAVEIGGRVNLEDGMALRLFVNAGVGFASTDSWSQDSRLAIAPPGTGSFTTRVGMDPVVGRVSVGAQLFASEAYEFRLQYDGEFGSTLTGHGGSLAVALRF